MVNHWNGEDTACLFVNISICKSIIFENILINLFHNGNFMHAENNVFSSKSPKILIEWTASETSVRE